LRVAVDFYINRFIGGGVEGKDLFAAAGEPDAVVVAVVALAVGELFGDFGDSIPSGLTARRAFNPFGRPCGAFDIGNREIAGDDHAAACFSEGVDTIEDRLIDNFGLEDHECFVTVGGECAVCNEQLVEDVEIAEIAEVVTRVDGELQVAAKAI